MLRQTGGGRNVESGPGGGIVRIPDQPDLSPIFATVATLVDMMVPPEKRFVLASAVNGVVNIALPPSPQTLPVIVKKKDSTGNAVNLRVSGQGTIDGVTSKAITTQNGVLRVAPVERVDGSGNRYVDWETW
jgi:hypothetical protein